MIIEKLAEHAFLGRAHIWRNIANERCQRQCALPFTVPAAAGLANNNDVRSTATDFIFALSLMRRHLG